jgi:hypothetical protein
MIIEDPIALFTELDIVDSYDMLLGNLSQHNLTLTDFSLHKDLNEEYSLYSKMDDHWVESIEYDLYVLEWKFKEKTGKELELKHKTDNNCQVPHYWIAVDE